MSSKLSVSSVRGVVGEEEEEEEEVEVEVRPLIKVVEYVESPIGEELLSKFADTSAFDFDYSQSSIWSPLLPRPQRSLLALDWEMGTPSKLSYSYRLRRLGFDKSTFKKVTTNLKNNIFTIFKKHQKIKRRTSFINPSHHFSPTPPSNKVRTHFFTFFLFSFSKIKFNFLGFFVGGCWWSSNRSYPVEETGKQEGKYIPVLDLFG